ncbi:class I SAM-dependent methyltransferase [Oleiagrimonas sp. C23AA]|uniref:class I SAM-dependent methyltransferase n=1 Tax=Oleiagrimonas sp. C23AA TaxID=2719047 RepID=UPI0031B680E1
MSTADSHEAQIRRCWQTNARAWTQTVRERGIESRRLVTDAAIVDAITALAPPTLIDLGCGEGWLCRALAENGARVIGVDAEPAFIEAACQATPDTGDIDYRVLDYAAVAAGELDARAAVVSCNFALLGKQSTEQLLAAVPSLLAPGGVFVMQTLHPLMACGDGPYVDGWRQGSWVGCGDRFRDPAPWYFRTQESWLALLARCGMRCHHLREPVHPHTGKPASLLVQAICS